MWAHYLYICSTSMKLTSASQESLGLAMACEEFCDDYLLLNPQEGGFFDLIRILLSRHTDHNNLTNCPKGTETRDFNRRRIIFISVLAQRVLLSLAKPVAWLGVIFEMLLNLMWCNRNMVVLLRNLFKGRLVMPDPTSETFVSLIGMLDDRVQLDSNIEYGDSRYYSALSIMAAKLAYENEAFIKNIVTNQWKMEYLGCYNFWNDYHEQLSTQAFMFCDSDLIMVAFRGTPPFDLVAWSTDVDLSFYELPSVGKVHGGFMKALGLQKTHGWPNDIEQDDITRPAAYYTIRERLRQLLKTNDNARFMVTGHSLGGALALLFPVVLAYHKESWILERCEGIYTYGQPRVGDGKLGEFMGNQLSVHQVQYVRSVYANDIVPRLPYDNSKDLYDHFGTCLYYDSLYEAKIVEDEPNKNYFNIMMVIPKILNAVWELIRSFIISYLKGCEYEEGLCMKIFRVIGLIIPGLSAHAPQDYVNCTRLRSSIIGLQLPNPANPTPKLD